jgi:hypothetical protein
MTLTTTPIKGRRGGRRSNPGGRPRAFRRPVMVRIKEDILQRLEPGAARKIRDLVETTFAKD